MPLCMHMMVFYLTSDSILEFILFICLFICLFILEWALISDTCLYWNFDPCYVLQVGTKVAAVSRKTNTTTHEVLGVLTKGNTQIVRHFSEK